MSRQSDSEEGKVEEIIIPLSKETVSRLLDWFHRSRVDYPWVGESDPWAVWVSEIMLQQTTVKTVETRYRRWMERFPTSQVLAAADEEEVLREWEGLGYYSRARNLALAARMVQERYSGVIPQNAVDLRKLPGVGEYTAAAIASLAFNERRAAVDANGRRIAQRLTAEHQWTSALEDAFRKTVERLMPADEPGELNAAMMQLGQLICTPRTPHCMACPLGAVCVGFLSGRQEEIPMRRRQKIIRKETPLALLVHQEHVVLHRKQGGIGDGLWVFPRRPEDMSNEWQPVENLPENVHTYTMYRDTLQPTVYHWKSSGEPLLPAGIETCNWVSFTELSEKPMPSAYRRITGNLLSLYS